MSGALPAVLPVAGVDVGSSAVKVVLLEDVEGGTPNVLVARTERIRRRDPQKVADELFAAAVQAAGLAPEQLGYVASTGEGELLEFRTGHFYGMTTHARGGLFLEPAARAIIDIGALHARAVLIDERAKVLGYRMTSQCASGSGQFLENICRYLGITIEEIGPLSVQAESPEVCSSICAVLAETDVINMVSRGIATKDIIKGIHQSMAGRYMRLLTSVGAAGVTLITGGLASDDGLLLAMREAAEAAGAKSKGAAPIEIRVHEQSALAGAFGAAFWGAFRARKLARDGVRFAAGAGA